MARKNLLVFREDWEAERNMRFNDSEVSYAFRVLQDEEMFNTYKKERAKAFELWKAEYPKPKYSRDELLIEIAKRLNIELV